MFERHGRLRCTTPVCVPQASLVGAHHSVVNLQVVWIPDVDHWVDGGFLGPGYTPFFVAGRLYSMLEYRGSLLCLEDPTETG